MKKRLIIALALLLLFSTYKPQKLFLNNKFNIKEIKIENNFIIKDVDIKRDLAFLYDVNLIFLNFTDIEKKLKKNDFIENFEIKKIYPNKLKIKIYEAKPLAILQNKKKKFYISKNITLINYLDLENYRNLPIVFGDKENFTILYTNLVKIKFPLEIIKKYYLYESKRWDLEIYQKKIVKLPIENYIKSLENFMNLQQENSFKKYKVFDYRINNQLILR
jgi:cell division septal protein FtsQ